MADFKSLNHKALIAAALRLTGQERLCQVELVACLAEIERREAYADEGFPTLFDFCLDKLRLSRGAAGRRVLAAQAARRFPEVLSMLSDASLTLSTVAALSPHLKGENGLRLLAQAQGKSRRDFDRLLASLSLQRECRDTVRLAAPSPPPAAANEVPELPLTAKPAVPLEPRAESASSAACVPLTARISFTAAEDILPLLQKAKDLLWHKHPEGRLEDVFREILLFFLARKDPGLKKPAAAPAQPAPSGSRRVPQWVKDAVWRRDGGRCAFVAADGWRCATAGGLEYDHAVPWALGGPSGEPGNVRLLCRTHNQMRAREVFGGKARPGLGTGPAA